MTTTTTNQQPSTSQSINNTSKASNTTDKTQNTEVTPLENAINIFSQQKHNLSNLIPELEYIHKIFDLFPEYSVESLFSGSTVQQLSNMIETIYMEKLVTFLFTMNQFAKYLEKNNTPITPETQKILDTASIYFTHQNTTNNIIEFLRKKETYNEMKQISEIVADNLDNSSLTQLSQINETSQLLQIALEKFNYLKKCSQRDITPELRKILHDLQEQRLERKKTNMSYMISQIHITTKNILDTITILKNELQQPQLIHLQKLLNYDKKFYNFIQQLNNTIELFNSSNPPSITNLNQTQADNMKNIITILKTLNQIIEKHHSEIYTIARIKQRYPDKTEKEIEEIENKLANKLVDEFSQCEQLHSQLYDNVIHLKEETLKACRLEEQKKKATPEETETQNLSNLSIEDGIEHLTKPTLKRQAVADSSFLGDSNSNPLQKNRKYTSTNEVDSNITKAQDKSSDSPSLG